MNKVQEIQLELVRHGGFNNFDGNQVANDLVEHQDLWRGALLIQEGPSDLIPLRDLSEGYWNADTLFILVAPGRQTELLGLVSDWDTSSIEWLTDKETRRRLGTSQYSTSSVLRLWWD